MKRHAKSKVFFAKILIFYIKTSKYGIFYIFLTYHEIIDCFKTRTIDAEHHFHRRTSRWSSNRPLTTRYMRECLLRFSVHFKINHQCIFWCEFSAYFLLCYKCKVISVVISRESIIIYLTSGIDISTENRKYNLYLVITATWNLKFFSN